MTARIADDGRDFAVVWESDHSLAAEYSAGLDAIDDRLADPLANDMGRRWRLGDAAIAMACSQRSLQRHLRQTGRSFSSVLRRARMRQATELLSRTDASLAEIGYCCGYADQVHFQRDFLRVTNMTPRAFRQVASPG